MPRMRRFLVAGSRTFNNYYLMYRYLKEYLPSGVIICNGGADGADQLAAVYAECNAHVYEAYPADWKRFGKQAGYIRNQQLAKLVDHAIFFWDGTSPSTKELIELVKRHRIEPVIIDITENDIIKPHPGRVVNVHRDVCDVVIARGNGSIWGNPYALSDTRNREYVVALFTDHLLKNMDLLKQIFDLKGKVLGCTCSPQLCHGDMIVWLLDNVESELKSLIIENVKKTLEDLDKPKKSFVPVEEVFQKWDKINRGSVLYTTGNSEVAKGFQNVVVENNRCYLEVAEKDVVKTNIWMTRSERDRQEEEPVSSYYKPMDGTRCEIFYRNQSFGDSPLRVGYWYINANDVHV